MLTYETIFRMAFVASVLTGLATEGLKKLTSETKINLPANITTCIVSAIICIFMYAWNIVNVGGAFAVNDVFNVVALIFVSALCAMLGYDKVTQAFGQFGN